MENPLHEHYGPHCIEAPHFSLLTACVYDWMHTVLLGMVNDTFVDAMDCIWMIGRKLDFERYKNNVAELDERIIKFPRHHAIAPFMLFSV